MEPEREHRACAGDRGAAAADTGEGEGLPRGRDEEGSDSITDMLEALRKEINADTERIIKQHDQTTMASVARLVRTQGEQNDAKFAYVRADISAVAERARALERERAEMRVDLARVSAGLALAERNYPIVGSDPSYDRELDPTLLRIHTKEPVSRADMLSLVREKLVAPAGVPDAEAILEETADSAKDFVLRFLGGPWLAASRARDANGCLRGPNGWERINVKSVAGPLVPVYVGSVDMRRDTTPHPTPHSPHPELRRALDGTYYTRSAFFKWYGTNEVWENAKPVVLAWDGRVSSTAEATSPAARSHPQPSSAGQPACAAPRLSVQSAPCLATQLSASKFLDTLEEATYKHEANPTQVTLLRELVNSLSSGDLLLMPTDEVWHLDEDQQEEKAIAKLDKLIELVVNIRTAWIASPEGEFARMSGHELQAAAEALLNSMSREKRAEYDFCFQARGSQRFLFALLRQPSFFNAEDLEKLLEEWANIKTVQSTRQPSKRAKGARSSKPSRRQSCRTYACESIANA